MTTERTGHKLFDTGENIFGDRKKRRTLKSDAFRLHLFIHDEARTDAGEAPSRRTTHPNQHLDAHARPSIAARDEESILFTASGFYRSISRYPAGARQREAPSETNHTAPLQSLTLSSPPPPLTAPRSRRRQLALIVGVGLFLIAALIFLLRAL